MSDVHSYTWEIESAPGTSFILPEYFESTSIQRKDMRRDWVNAHEAARRLKAAGRPRSAQTIINMAKRGDITWKESDSPSRRPLFDWNDINTKVR